MRPFPACCHGQLTIWLIYAGLLYVFLRCLRKSGGQASRTPEASAPLFRFSWRGFVWACAVATVVTTLSRLLLFPFAMVQVLFMFTFYVVSGIALLAGLLTYAGHPSR